MEYLNEINIKILKIIGTKRLSTMAALDDKLNVGIKSISSNLIYLIEEKYIRKNELSSLKDARGISFNDSFELTVKGKQRLEYINYENKRFFLRSVLTPIVVAFVTAFLVSYFMK